ncbi:MAG: acyltransferase [Thermodesulfobacteriota bacterium]
MIDTNLVHNKIEFKAARLYTAFLRSSFKYLGRGSLIFFPVRITGAAHMVIGRRALIMPGVWLNVVENWGGRSYQGRLVMGDRVTIRANVQISTSDLIYLGDNVAIGQGSTIVDHAHDYSVVDEPIVFAPLTDPCPVFILEDVVISNNCFIGPGVTIGRHAMVAVNSVVLKDVPEYTLVAGNPARIIRRYDFQTSRWVKA